DAHALLLPFPLFLSTQVRRLDDDDQMAELAVQRLTQVYVGLGQRIFDRLDADRALQDQLAGRLGPLPVIAPIAAVILVGSPVGRRHRVGAQVEFGVVNAV